MVRLYHDGCAWLLHVAVSSTLAALVVSVADCMALETLVSSPLISRSQAPGSVFPLQDLPDTPKLTPELPTIGELDIGASQFFEVVITDPNAHQLSIILESCQGNADLFVNQRPLRGALSRSRLPRPEHFLWSSTLPGQAVDTVSVLSPQGRFVVGVHSPNATMAQADSQQPYSSRSVRFRLFATLGPAASVGGHAAENHADLWVARQQWLHARSTKSTDPGAGSSRWLKVTVEVPEHLQPDHVQLYFRRGSEEDDRRSDVDASRLSVCSVEHSFERLQEIASRDDFVPSPSASGPSAGFIGSWLPSAGGLQRTVVVMVPHDARGSKPIGWVIAAHQGGSEGDRFSSAPLPIIPSHITGLSMPSCGVVGAVTRRSYSQYVTTFVPRVASTLPCRQVVLRVATDPGASVSAYASTIGPPTRLWHEQSVSEPGSALISLPMRCDSPMMRVFLAVHGTGEGQNTFRLDIRAFDRPADTDLLSLLANDEGRSVWEDGSPCSVAGYMTTHVGLPPLPSHFADLWESEQGQQRYQHHADSSATLSTEENGLAGPEDTLGTAKAAGESLSDDADADVGSNFVFSPFKPASVFGRSQDTFMDVTSGDASGKGDVAEGFRSFTSTGLSKSVFGSFPADLDGVPDPRAHWQGHPSGDDHVDQVATVDVDVGADGDVALFEPDSRWNGPGELLPGEVDPLGAVGPDKRAPWSADAFSSESELAAETANGFGADPGAEWPREPDSALGFGDHHSEHPEEDHSRGEGQSQAGGESDWFDSPHDSDGYEPWSSDAGLDSDSKLDPYADPPSNGWAAGHHDYGGNPLEQPDTQADREWYDWEAESDSESESSGLGENQSAGPPKHPTGKSESDPAQESKSGITWEKIVEVLKVLWSILELLLEFMA